MTADTSTNLPLVARIGEVPLAVGDPRAVSVLQSLRERVDADPALAPLSRALAEPRAAGLLGRVLGLGRSGVYRQTPLGNLGLWIGALANRL